MNWEGFWRRYQDDRWEPETKALLEAILRPGDLFVDVGAWIGPVSRWAIDLGARVIAIEPDKVAVDELRRVVPGAEVWAMAVVPDEGTRKVRLAPNPRGAYGDSMARIAPEGRPVQARTLPMILGGRRPSLVTIDVEGYEIELLPTLAPWLGQMGVPLQVELHNELPDPAWFAAYSDVEIPEAPRDRRGRPNHVVAR